MINIDGKKFDQELGRFRRKLLLLVKATRQRAITEVRRHTVSMRSLARKESPRATGTLRRSVLDTYAKQGLEGVVTSTAPYAEWVEGFRSNYAFGRRPGKWPPVAPILKWVIIRGLARKWRMSEASAVFLVRRKIGKKGTPAQPHIKPAFEDVAPRFEAAMDKVFSDAAKQIGGGG